MRQAPRPAIVMETLTGATLEHQVREQRPLSGGELGVVGEQLASALVGVILHEAATGRAPLIDLADELDSDTPQLEGRVPELRGLRPRLPRGLTGAIDACLDPDPAAHPTMAELREACAAT